jgi:sortase A
MKTLEYLLLAIGAAFLGWCAWTLGESRLYQNANRSRFSSHETRPALPASLPAPSRRAVADGTAVGRIDIPRIGMSAIIAEGDGEATLRIAVGHIPGTAFPGRGGNVGLAGHRDTFFRALSRIRVHDEIRIAGEGGIATVYRVASTAVVEPSDVSVLESGPLPSLTLVTCYPFHYVGAAPKRFVVKATRISI